MVYKVMVKGTCVEFTRSIKKAREAFDEGSGNRQIFALYEDGSAKLVKQELK